MLRIRGMPQRLCDGVGRRDFLRVGALSACGLTLPGMLRASEPERGARTPTFGKARRCLLLYLTGGPPQLDTWDLKPDAPDRIRGEFKPISTNVPGIRISEWFPRLARCADKMCIVRSVSHADRTHPSAGYTMLTGVPHPLANAATAATIRPGPSDHPHVGSLLAMTRRRRNSAPPFVSLPEIIKDAGVNKYPGLDGGMLGRQYAPFLVEADAENDGFRVPDVFLPANVTAQRLSERRVLVDQLDRGLRNADTRLGQDMEGWYRQAYEAMAAPAFREAFVLDREPLAVRQRYGNHLFGQGCLLARRLLEAGVGMAAVYWHQEGPPDSLVWDTHQNNFGRLRESLMPPTDAAFSALLEDLEQRGMLDDTLVVCMGDFGRSPLINRSGGRDHWSAVQSIVLAGGGVRRGQVYGASDRDGGQPADRPVAPADLTATWLHLLGIPGDLMIHDRTGRPLRACVGETIPGLLA